MCTLEQMTGELSTINITLYMYEFQVGLVCMYIFFEGCVVYVGQMIIIITIVVS